MDKNVDKFCTIESMRVEILLASNIWPVMVHCHEGCGPHGVANIEEALLACNLQYLVNGGRYVIASHLIPGKLPELSFI